MLRKKLTEAGAKNSKDNSGRYSDYLLSTAHVKGSEKSANGNTTSSEETSSKKDENSNATYNSSNTFHKNKMIIPKVNIVFG